MKKRKGFETKEDFRKRLQERKKLKDNIKDMLEYGNYSNEELKKIINVLINI